MNMAMLNRRVARLELTAPRDDGAIFVAPGMRALHAPMANARDGITGLLPPPQRDGGCGMAKLLSEARALRAKHLAENSQ